jgi:hypothetical protein
MERANGTKRPIKNDQPFKLQPSARDAWLRFTYELDVALGAMEEDEFLVVQIKKKNRYVQFAAQGAFGMRAEAASNFYLPEGESLNEVQNGVLLELGWHPPSKLPPELNIPHDADGSANYYLDLAAPVPYARLALLSVNTLRLFGATHPGELQYSAFARSGTEIKIAGLSIKRKAG